MIYGFRGDNEDGHYVIVAAAETLADFRALEERAKAAGARVPRSYEFLQDDRLANMAHAYVYQADTVDAVDAFIADLGVETLNRVRVLDYQRNMVALERDDPYGPLSKQPENAERRTLGDIHGLLEDDPWDRRTPEQQEAAKQAQAKGKEAKKRGDLTGDSFKPKGGGVARVTNIEMTETADGQIRVDDVRAVKIGEKTDLSKLSHAAQTMVKNIEAMSPALKGYSLSRLVKMVQDGTDHDGTAKEVTEYFGHHPEPEKVQPGPKRSFIDDLKDAAQQLGVTGGVVVQNEDGSRTELVPPLEPQAEDEEDLNEEGFPKPPANKADLYFATGIDDMMRKGLVYICFASKEFWEKERCLPDWHMGDDLHAAYGDLPFNLHASEDMENGFTAWGPNPTDDNDPLPTQQEVIDALTAFGFTHKPEMLAEAGQDIEDEEDHGGCDHDHEPKEPAYTSLTFLIDATEQAAIDVLASYLGVEMTSRGTGWFQVDEPMQANNLAVLMRRRGHTFKALMSKDFEPAEAISLIVQRQMFAMYFRVDFPNLSIEQVMDSLDAKGVRRESLLGRGEYEGGTYVVCTVERVATDNAEIVKADYPGSTYEVYAVDGRGERLAPEGITVLDPNATPEIGPRPWDNDPSAWNALTDEQRAEEKKKITPDEFLITGSYVVGRGSLLYVTPAAYFNEHRAMWEGDLDEFVAPLLFKTMVREDKNFYRERNLDFDAVIFNLGKKGFKDSILFRMWVNANY